VLAPHPDPVDPVDLAACQSELRRMREQRAQRIADQRTRRRRSAPRGRRSATP
jgi:hypothetical protein